MIGKFTRSTSRKKQSSSSSSVNSPSNTGGGGGGLHNFPLPSKDSRSSSDAASSSPRRSNQTSRSTPPGAGLGEHLSREGGGGGNGGGRRNKKLSSSASAASSTGGGSRRYSSAQSVASISSASVFAPSVAPSTAGGGGGINGRGGGTGGGLTELQPSSARLLRDLNKSANSSLLSSLGTAASRTFRSYKMTLPRFPPVIRSDFNDSTYIDAGGGGNDDVNDHDDDVDKPLPPAPPVETDLELLGRTVHAVSSALTEPPKDGERYMIYDVGFNPRGCVWDALVVVQVEKGDDDGSASVDGSSRAGSLRGSTNREGKKSGGGGSRSGSVRRSSSNSGQRGGGSDNSLATGGKEGSGSAGVGVIGTFTFPIRVTCAEDEDDDTSSAGSSSRQHQQQQQAHRPRAKTYAVDVSVIDDSVNHPISRWSAAEALERRDDMKNAMEWVSYGIRRSMARSMFPKFPEGCQGRPFREIYQLNKKVRGARRS